MFLGDVGNCEGEGKEGKMLGSAKDMATQHQGWKVLVHPPGDGRLGVIG